MAKRRGRAELSAEFLADQKGRLDAIGPWTVDADASNLDIRWAEPPALRGAWVPLGLWFHTGSERSEPEAGEFDPDERMFALYQQFLDRRDAFLGQLRALAAEVGTAEQATVEVYRERDDDEEMNLCDIQVSFRFAEDGGEHRSFARYDPEADAFDGLEG